MCPVSVIAKPHKGRSHDPASGRSITGEQAHCNILMINPFRYLTPCNLVEIEQFLETTCISCLPSNRKIGQFGSFYLPMEQSIRCHVQENNNLHIYNHENLMSHKDVKISGNIFTISSLFRQWHSCYCRQTVQTT
jgi:hypothetical protein